MIFDNAMANMLKYIPNIEIKYKNTSLLMKIISLILFFNPTFLTSYITTIGRTIYVPNENFVRNHPISAVIVLFHESMHMLDSTKLNNILFSFLYLFPQSLILFTIPLFFINWLAALIFLIILLSPIPSPTRAYFEKRAYFASLYVMNILNKKEGSGIDLDDQAAFFIDGFKDKSYYFMFPFSKIDKEFQEALFLIKNGKRPFEHQIFDIIDECLI